MTAPVCLIRPENYKKEVSLENKPVLLLCMHYGEEFNTQLKIIEAIAERYGNDVKVGLLEEAFIDVFKQELKIHGTPTFLILVNGKERNRMLGLTDQDSLQDFIFSSYVHDFN